jgi:hypothetical protein
MGATSGILIMMFTSIGLHLFLKNLEWGYDSIQRISELMCCLCKGYSLSLRNILMFFKLEQLRHISYCDEDHILITNLYFLSKSLKSFKLSTLWNTSLIFILGTDSFIAYKAIYNLVVTRPLDIKYFLHFVP